MALDLGEGRVLVDVTITNPFASAGQTNLINAGSPAAAAASAYDRKLTKWRNLFDDQQLSNTINTTQFQPLAVTALGAWDERSLLWLKRFSRVCRCGGDRRWNGLCRVDEKTIRLPLARQFLFVKSPALYCRLAIY